MGICHGATAQTPRHSVCLAPPGVFPVRAETGKCDRGIRTRPSGPLRVLSKSHANELYKRDRPGGPEGDFYGRRSHSAVMHVSSRCQVCPVLSCPASELGAMIIDRYEKGRFETGLAEGHPVPTMLRWECIRCTRLIQGASSQFASRNVLTRNS